MHTVICDAFFIIIINYYLKCIDILYQYNEEKVLIIRISPIPCEKILSFNNSGLLDIT